MLKPMIERALLFLAVALWLVPPTIARAEKDPDHPERVQRRAPPAKAKHGHHDDDRESGRKAKGQRKGGKHPGHRKGEPEARDFGPTSGPPSTIVTIRGKRLRDTASVRLHGLRLPIVRRDSRELQVRIPARATSGRIVVIGRRGQRQVLRQAFKVVRLPTIHRVHPRHGRPGTLVTLHGRHFAPGDQLMLGGMTLTPRTIQPRRISVELPSGAKSGHFTIHRDGAVVARAQAVFAVRAPLPRIHHFEPARGEAGDTVRLHGDHFGPHDEVRLGSQVLPVSRRSERLVEVVIRGTQSGRFTVRGPDGRRAISSQRFAMLPSPRVSRFTPRWGSPGTIVTFPGGGLLPSDKVFLGNRPLLIRSATRRRVVAEIPTGALSGSFSIRRGPRSYPISGAFRVLARPTITAFAPARGGPGTVVQFRGEALPDDASVYLGNRRLSIVRRHLPTELWVRIPSGVRSSYLQIKSRAGTARAAAQFEVSPRPRVRAVRPTRGAPGTTVQIRGQHLAGDAAVYLGSVQLEVIRAHANTLVVRIPSGAQTGRLSVRSFDQRIDTPITFRVDEPRRRATPAQRVVAPQPVAAPQTTARFSFAPHFGGAGTKVTIALRRPRSPIAIYFNGRALPKHVHADGLRVTVTLPPGARTDYFEVEYRGRRYRAAEPFQVR